METLADTDAWGLAGGRAKDERLLAFQGSSMEPTLRAGQMLEIAACEWDQVRVGDVIAFRKAGWREAVVHRVIGRMPYGLRTCGDSHAGEDPWLVRPDEFLGRVVAARSGSRLTAVAGGRMGQATRAWARVSARMRWMVRFMLRPPYRWLSGRRILGRLLPASWRPRLVRFETQGGHRLRVMVGQRVAGWFDEQVGKWVIRQPYRLLISDCGLRVSFEIPRVRWSDPRGD